MTSPPENELGASREQGPEALVALSQLALDHMEQGVCVYDAHNRIVLVNQRYLSFFNMSSDVVRVGTTYREVLAHSARCGNFPQDQLDALYSARIAKIAAGKPFRTEQRLASGLVMSLELKPLPGGGWMTICDDVSRLARLEAELRVQTERSQHALANMSHGLIMYDVDSRVVVCNERFLKLYDLDPEIVKPGVPHCTVIEHWMSRGNMPGMSGDEFHESRLDDVRRRKAKTLLVMRYDGRMVQAVSRFLPDGGWVTLHEDVTERLQYEETLRQQNFMLDAALENMAHGLAFYDSDMRLRVCNTTYRRIYRLSPEETRPGTHLAELIERSMANGAFSSEHSPQQLLEAARKMIAIRDSSPMRRRMSNGTVVSVRYCALSEGGFVATYEDITERERAIEQLSEQYRRFDAALNNMSQGLCMLDSSLRVIVCNRRYIEMYGLPPEIVKPGVSMREIMEHSCELGDHPDTTGAKLYADYVERLREGEHTLHRHLSDGRIIKLNHKRMEHGGWVVTYEDVTERHKAQARVAHMARHDSLTDLPNRTLFREKMSEGLNQVATAGGAMAVLCFDLDNFKTVNDRLGHAAGDRLLRWVAARLKENVGEHDTVARLGGDEFAILQRGPQPQSAEQLARRLVEISGHPPPLESQSIHVGVSVGIAIAPDHGLDADELMKCADLALYQAKARGRGAHQLFEPEMEEAAQPPRAGAGSGRRAGRTRIPPGVPAADAARSLRAHRLRGAAPLETSLARLCLSCRVHSDCGGERADRSDRRMGAAHGLRIRGVLARCHRRGEPVASAIPRARAGGDGHKRTCGSRPAPATARTRGHRDGAAGRQRGDDRDPAPASRARGTRQPRRFRRRLFIAQLSAQVSVRPYQDRPLLRRHARRKPGERCHRPHHREPRFRARRRDHG